MTDSELKSALAKARTIHASPMWAEFLDRVANKEILNDYKDSLISLEDIAMYKNYSNYVLIDVNRIHTNIRAYDKNTKYYIGIFCNIQFNIGTCDKLENFQKYSNLISRVESELSSIKKKLGDNIIVDRISISEGVDSDGDRNGSDNTLDLRLCIVDSENPVSNEEIEATFLKIADYESKNKPLDDPKGKKKNVAVSTFRRFISESSKSQLDVEDVRDCFLELSDEYDMIDISSISYRTLRGDDKNIYFDLRRKNRNQEVHIDIVSNKDLSSLYEYLNMRWSSKVKERLGYHVEVYIKGKKPMWTLQIVVD